MSLLSLTPDLTPLINQIQQFTLAQNETNQLLLEKINQDKTNSCLLLQELREIKELLKKK